MRITQMLHRIKKTEHDATVVLLMRKTWLTSKSAQIYASNHERIMGTGLALHCKTMKLHKIYEALVFRRWKTSSEDCDPREEVCSVEWPVFYLGMVYCPQAELKCHWTEEEEMDVADMAGVGAGITEDEPRTSCGDSRRDLARTSLCVNRCRRHGSQWGHSAPGDCRLSPTTGKRSSWWTPQTLISGVRKDVTRIRAMYLD